MPRIRWFLACLLALNTTIAQLDALLKGDPGKEARAAFKEALRLGAGGPFHRAWIYLRLGNMADVDGDRKLAKKNYKLATEQGTRYHTSA